MFSFQSVQECLVIIKSLSVSVYLQFVSNTMEYEQLLEARFQMAVRISVICVQYYGIWPIVGGSLVGDSN